MVIGKKGNCDYLRFWGETKLLNQHVQLKSSREKKTLVFDKGAPRSILEFLIPEGV